MKRFKRLLFILCIVFATLTTFLAQKVFLSYVEEQNAIDYIDIPVAQEDLLAMTKINESNITFISVPADTLQEMEILIDKKEILNRTLLLDLKKNSPFLSTQVSDGNMSTPFHISENERAITIHNSPLLSLGGYLQEGMHVDIFWTYSVGEKTITKLAFQNVEVIAVGSPNHTGVKGDATLTLKLSLSDSQKLILMEKYGEFRFLLRPSQITPSRLLQEIDFSTLENE